MQGALQSSALMLLCYRQDVPSQGSAQELACMQAQEGLLQPGLCCASTQGLSCKPVWPNLGGPSGSLLEAHCHTCSIYSGTHDVLKNYIWRRPMLHPLLGCTPLEVPGPHAQPLPLALSGRDLPDAKLLHFLQHLRQAGLQLSPLLAHFAQLLLQLALEGLIVVAEVQGS